MKQEIKISFTMTNYNGLELIELTIIVLFTNRFILSPDVYSKFEIKSSKLSKISDKVLLSSKL